MPVLTPTPGAPYPTSDEVLNRARAITNDAAQTIAGNLLANAQPYTFEDLNKAYEDIQFELANHGYENQTVDTVISAIPVCAASVQTDPGVQLFMSYTEFFDGVNSFTTPVLPQDLMIPLRLWERQNGTLCNFYEMYPVNDGLPSIGRNASLVYWDWINSTLYLIGATQVQDIRMRYIRRLPAVSQASDPILIPDSKNAIANRIAYTFANARGSELADKFLAQSDADIQRIVSRTSRKKQRGSHRRMPYGGGGSSGRNGNGFSPFY